MMNFANMFLSSHLGKLKYHSLDMNMKSSITVMQRKMGFTTSMFESSCC